MPMQLNPQMVNDMAFFHEFIKDEIVSNRLIMETQDGVRGLLEAGLPDGKVAIKLDSPCEIAVEVYLDDVEGEELLHSGLALIKEICERLLAKYEEPSP